MIFIIAGLTAVVCYLWFQLFKIKGIVEDYIGAVRDDMANVIQSKLERILRMVGQTHFSHRLRDLQINHNNHDGLGMAMIDLFGHDKGNDGEIVSICSVAIHFGDARFMSCTTPLRYFHAFPSVVVTCFGEKFPTGSIFGLIGDFEKVTNHILEVLPSKYPLSAATRGSSANADKK